MGPALKPAPDRQQSHEEMLATLTLEEKITLLTGADYWSLRGHPGIGLRPIRTSDGPAGVRGTRWDESDKALNVPAPVALAATWDPRRAELIGNLLAAQCREKNVDVLLAPTVNLQRSPFGGRDFEFLGEDPLLTGVMGAAIVIGLQRGGVAATVKHFVANDSETERFTVDNSIDERVLRELYLAPFEIIVARARPWAVMAAYNSVNGHTMTESPMLAGVLKHEWGFDGLVMSDWHAARTIAAASAGVDLVMPGPSGPWGDALAVAVREELVSEATVDDKVLRILRLATRVGALRPSPGTRDTGQGRQQDSWPDERAREALRSTAAASFILARNEQSLLPLDPGSMQRMAVIGPNAATPRTLGGGSATVFPAYRVSPLDGLRAALAMDATVDHSPGVRSHARIPVARSALLHMPGSSEPGALVEFVSEGGTVLHTEHRTGGSYIWRSLPEAARAGRFIAVRVTTAIRAPVDGTYLIACSGHGHFRLALAGELAFDAHLTVPAGTDPTEAYIRPPQHSTAVSLRAGQSIDIVLVHQPGGHGDQTSFVLGGVSFQLNIEEPYLPDDEEIERAVRLAGAADVAVVVVGTTEEVESEGFDRATLDLPGRQDELVRRIVGANPRTVVVVNTGAPVLLPWAETVPAVLLTPFPGQEYGNALADVLLGRSEPGGRLPVTWPESPDDLPATKPADGVVNYGEGLHIGYRYFDRTRRQPRYPFGHGLGYTDWDYLSTEFIAAHPAPLALDCERVPQDQDAVISVRVRNTGVRYGSETVQVYASRPDSKVERPVRWLAGFAIVRAAPGAEAVADIALPLRRLAYWETASGSWVIEPGDYQLAIGRSSRDLPITLTISVESCDKPQSFLWIGANVNA
jgi:beta-glucosidase